MTVPASLERWLVRIAAAFAGALSGALLGLALARVLPSGPEEAGFACIPFGAMAGVAGSIFLTERGSA
jgi:hypothetical protein